MGIGTSGPVELVHRRPNESVTMFVGYVVALLTAFGVIPADSAVQAAVNGIIATLPAVVTSLVDYFDLRARRPR